MNHLGAGGPLKPDPPSPYTGVMLKPMTPPRQVRPCWTGPARLLLIAVALPLGVRFAARPPSPDGSPAAWPLFRVDPNAVPAPVLEALPGIGPALGGRIVAARPLGSLADLDRRVKGIGPAKVAALRPFLQFIEPPPAP